MINKKKSQVKFGETFGIIIIVYIVIVMGMVWYNKINTNDINEMTQKDNLQKAFEKYNYMVNSDLLHLSQQGDVDEEFDLQAIKTFEEYSNSTQGKEIVRRQLGESTITIKIMSKDPTTHEFQDEEEFLIYNNTPNKNKKIGNGVFEKNKFRTLIPVVDSIEKKTKLGLLEVTVYN